MKKRRIHRLQNFNIQSVKKSTQNRWDDWESFCNSCTIRSGAKMVPFQPFDFQKKFIDILETHNNILCVKTRQLGITQIICSWLLYKAIQNPAWVCAVFCRGQTEVSALSRRVKQMIASADIECEIDNISLLKIAGGGELHFKNTSREGLRSQDAVSAILWDEAAFVDNISEIYSSSVAACSTVENSKQIVISTPSAKSGWYWDKLSENCPEIEKKCEDVASGSIPGGLHYWTDSNICKVICHWKAHPFFNQKSDYLKWRKEQENCDEETLQREHNLKFINAAVAVFPFALVTDCCEEYSLEKEADFDNGDYFAGLDCSAMGQDYTVLTIYQLGFDGVYRLVAMYRKRQETMQYHLNKISELLEEFEPTLTIETTGGTGQNYLDELTMAFQHLSIHKFNTTQASKTSGISRLILLMEKGKIKFPKKSPLVDELLSFQRKDSGRMEAAPGKYDDILMSTVFALSN